MKILVTGGGGFLGQALCRGLVERGHEVISLNRGYYPVLRELGVGQVQGDLADAHAVRHAADGVDAALLEAGMQAQVEPVAPSLEDVFVSATRRRLVEEAA